jgi:hypothetical protein
LPGGPVDHSFVEFRSLSGCRVGRAHNCRLAVGHSWILPRSLLRIAARPRKASLGIDWQISSAIPVPALTGLRRWSKRASPASDKDGIMLL